MNGHPPHDRVEPGEADFWARGGLWVAVQFPLGLLVLLAAFCGPKLPSPIRGSARWLGLGLLLPGGALFVAGTAALGRGLTPFPRPPADAVLVTSGAFGLARHPLYGGAILGGIGWALLHGRWLGLLAALVLAIFFDAKASHEERWLATRFPEYAAYRQRVHKLIPGLY